MAHEPENLSLDDSLALMIAQGVTGAALVLGDGTTLRPTGPQALAVVHFLLEAYLKQPAPEPAPAPAPAPPADPEYKDLWRWSRAAQERPISDRLTLVLHELVGADGTLGDIADLGSKLRTHSKCGPRTYTEALKFLNHFGLGLPKPRR